MVTPEQADLTGMGRGWNVGKEGRGRRELGLEPWEIEGNVRARFGPCLSAQVSVRLKPGRGGHSRLTVNKRRQ
jgi:hypothetical protein